MMEYTLFGESHGPAVGVLLTEVPSGLTIDEALMQADITRRAGGKSPLTTARREADQVEFLSGVFEGKTTGDPLCAVLRNRDVRSGDYEALREVARPGHADYIAFLKSRGFNDYRGGGHFSGRLTAPLVVAGSLAKQLLKEQHITIKAHIIDENGLKERAMAAKAAGDSVGGQILCTVTGVPGGLGGRDWRQAVDSEIARHVFAIPAVKAVGFGEGEDFAALRGSEANDAYAADGNRIFTRTNHSGGISGGVANGMPITFTVTFRPTPSIAKEQQTVNFRTGEEVTLSVSGRHDPCVVFRAVPAVEAAAALALCQLIEPQPRPDDLSSLRLALDRADAALVELWEERLRLVEQVGAYKKEHHLPVRDAQREQAVLESRTALLQDEKWKDATKQLFQKIMEISRNEEK